MELDILRQTIQEHVLGEESLFNQKQLSFMNEIIRPILERIRYHFLQHVNEGISGEHREHKLPNATHEKTVRFPSSWLDRLPEWVLFFIKEIIVENRVWNMLQDCNQDDVMSSEPPTSCRRKVCNPSEDRFSQRTLSQKNMMRSKLW